MIGQIVEGQAASKADLRDGDIVLAMNGKPLEQLSAPELSARNFDRNIARTNPGTKLTLTVKRNEEVANIEVTTEAIPTQPSEAENMIDKRTGIFLREKVLLDRYLDTSPDAKAPGLLVQNVIKDSPSAVAGVTRGDLITTVNDQPVQTIAAYKQIVEAAAMSSAGTTINLLIRRDGEPTVIAVELTP